MNMRMTTILTGSLLGLLAAHGTVFAADAALPSTTPLPAAQTLTAAGEGRRLYLKLNCYSCHGMAAGGGMGPAIAHAEIGDVSEAVKQGEDTGMRSYRGYVTNKDVNNLAAYLSSIGTPNEPTFKDWWVAVPPK
jgi:mono/diheme cytochrome c family protein